MSRRTSLPIFAAFCLAALWLVPGGEAWAGDGVAVSRATRTPDVNEGELETLVVTATRTPMAVGDLPVTVTVIGPEDIARSPTKTLDELLRSAPSFGLFRRSSSVAADPSSQGVKLRNIGASGISRALVLVDGIPENDPFGGWVAWRALPRIGLERVEIVPGGGSALYGNYALGGVIQAISRPIGAGDLEAQADYGSFDTVAIAARAAGRAGSLGGALEGEYFDSNGYPVVAKYARGGIDGDTPSHHGAVNGKLEYEASPDLRLDLKAGWFDEELNAGTRYTTAAMQRTEFSTRAVYAPAGEGSYEFTVFGHDGEFQQDRARVGPGRNSETLSGHQDVPTQDLGVSLVWNGPPLSLAGSHSLTLGTDARWIDGMTRERLYPTAASLPGNPTVQRNAGGRQQLTGVFAEDVYDPTQTVGTVLALRYDHWGNASGWRDERAYDGTLTSTSFADRSGSELSPKLAVHWQFAKEFAARASAYRSFRAPTLDELYRPFQAGTVRTESNPDLDPESLTGAEAGLDAGGADGPVLRLTAFRNLLHDPIVNVTTGPNARQRRNLGEARIQGFEVDANWPFAPHWSVEAAATVADTEVTEAPGQPQLVGKELPQAPRTQARIALAFDDPARWTATIAVRYVGEQYENDVNTLPMDDVWLTDVFASWHATRRVEVFLAVENLFDATYLVGRSGVDTIGQPRFVHGGVRLRLEP